MADVQVHVDVAALNRFLNRTVQPFLRKAAEEIASEARRNAPHGSTNELANSIRVTEGTRGSVRVEVTAPYAGYVSQGTGPGADPPRTPYYPKLRRRGLILWSEDRRLNPYSVAHGIAQKGTPANPYFENAVSRILTRFQFRWIRRDLQL